MNEESIFAAALEKKSPAEREAFLDVACRGNADLRAQVDELLSASNAAGSFFEHPPAGLDVTVDAAAHDTHKPATWDGSLAFLKPCESPGRIGKLVGNAGEYEIIEVVGSGGMGIVLRAFDTKLSRVVAVKVLAPELARNPTAVKRFLREAKAAAAVVHDHVVTIHNVEETHQPPFLVMQFIDGQTLQQKIDRQGALELKEILRIGCQSAAGLAAAHKHGLIHRDIKPANILLENGIERVKITDFGLARAADDVEITQTGLIAGTPQYMSPEQTRGEPMDARSDLFSLGSVLYTMCSGRPAFRAETTMGVLRRVCDDEPRAIHEVNAEIPPWLEGIVSKLLAKNPGERFQTAAEVSELLGQCLGHVQNPASVPLPAVAFAAPATVFLPPPAKTAGSRVRVPRDWVTFMFVTVFSVVVLLPLVLATVSVMSWFFHRGKDTSSAELPAETRFNITGEWFSDRGEALQLAYAFTADLRGETVDMSGEWNWVDRPTNQPSRLLNARFHQQRRVLESELQSSDGSKVSVVWELGDGGHTLLGKVFKEGRLVRDWNFTRERPKVSEVISLFNGEDLAGWRAHPESSTAWTVKDNLLVGRGANQYLFSEQGDYWDFRLRAEVKISGDGDGGILVRMAPPAASRGPLSGYEVQIAGDPNHVSPTGTIIRHGASVTTENAVAPGAKGRGDLIRPDQWFNLEISAIGGELTVSIDGQPVVNYYDDAPRTSGHIALQSFSDTAAVSFRKIEIQELPPGRPRDILIRGEPATATKLYALAAAPGGWTALFNGRDLSGWLEPPQENRGGNVVDGFPGGTVPGPVPVPVKSSDWNVVDGVLVGRGAYSYLVSQRRDYRDFLLRAEVRINEGGNSGLYFRAELPADWKTAGCVGYEAEINSTDGEGKTGSLRRYPRSPVLQQVDETLVPAGEWFTYEVLAVEDRIATFVNGKLAASAIDDTHAQGRIALQLIREEQTVVEFRKIEIKEQLPTLPQTDAGGFVPLFNKTDLAGWKTHPDLPGGWEVKQGLLTGSTQTGYLFSERDYANFHLRAEVKTSDRGDAGVFIRAPFALRQGEQAWMIQPASGYEAELYNNPELAGTLWEIVPQQAPGLLAPAKGSRLARPDEWFTLEIIAQDNHFTTKVNGQVVVSARDTQSKYARGHIVLSAWGKETVVQFRKIEIKELTTGTAPDTGPLAVAAGDNRRVTDWAPLFNGSDFRGWVYDKRAQDPELSSVWKVDGGVLSAVGGASGAGALRSERTYENYVLQLKFRFPEAEGSGRTPGDAGLILHRRDGQAADNPSGFKFTLGRAADGQPMPVEIMDQCRADVERRPISLVAPGQWNDLVIASRSGTLEVSINSQLAALLTGCSPRRGYIALESHGTPVEFRDILIREELPAAPSANWTPLFDGTSLSGWTTHSSQPGGWEVKDGILVGRSSHPSHLFTRRGDYQNFHLRFEAKLNDGGDSGVIFRAPFSIKPGANGPLGYEAQIAAKTGTLLEGKNVYGDPAGIKPDTWFTGEVIAAGKQIIVRINGQTTANFEDAERLYTKGHIALQVWNPQTVVHFRNVEIKELPSGTPSAESSSGAASGSSAGAAPPLAVAPFDAAQAKVHQDTWASHLGTPVEITNSLGMKLRLIPPGQFTMGSSAEEQQSALANMEQTMRRADRGDEQGRVAYVESIRPLVASEGPAHHVTLTQPYYMSATEVTAAQFAMFVKATNHVTSAERSEKGGIVWGRSGHESSKEFQWRTPGRLPRTPDHPVTQVSYNDAVAFCKWLSETEGRAYSLPTEAQWEFACRGGTQTPWSFGNDAAEIEKYCWAEVKVDPTIKEFEFHKVGQKLTNAFGLGDMHGNVQEWCRDWFSHTTYSVRAELDPAGATDPDDEQTRVVRGGAIFLPYDLRSAIRRRANVEYAENGLGFRVVVVGVSKPQQPMALIWGQVKDGYQVGLGFKDGKLRYKAGEPVEFELKVRNTTDAEKTIEIDKPQESEVWYSGEGELSVKLLGREKEQVALKPREEKVIPITPHPSGESIAIFQREPKAAAATNPQIKTDGLTTGFYRVSFTTYMSGAKQELSAPNFGFHFDDEGAPPAFTKGRTPAEGPPNNPGLKNVVWGDPVMGLSVGIGLPTQASELEDGIRIVYLWNTTDAPIDVQHFSHRLQDWQLVARDAKGNEFRSLGILTGPKMLTRARLEPGQVVTPGSLTINCNWTTAERAPRGKLAPGTYKLTTTFDCRRLDYGHFTLRITSGEAREEIN